MRCNYRYKACLCYSNLRFIWFKHILKFTTGYELRKSLKLLWNGDLSCEAIQASAIKVTTVEETNDINSMTILLIYSKHLNQGACDDSSITKHEDGRRLTNYVAFTSKMVVGVAIDSNNYRDSDDESTEDFVNSYNLMLGISTFVLWDSSRVL
ncbi:hypothetical protein V6N13_049648 [Hibiscus sabdariffa]